MTQIQLVISALIMLICLLVLKLGILYMNPMYGLSLTL
ncbi:hypothetical protein RU94_GL001618 [Enterococcus asini]|nr:hypothetical protein RU94_GL001618 [Enterococcus asini]